jgi:hypothetical protein
MCIFRQHDRHRLPDMAHLLVRKDGLVVEGRPVIGICNEAQDVLNGNDAMDAGELLRGARLDPADAAMRDRAAKDFSMQHAGKAKVVRVRRAPRHLGACFEARNAAADLSHC